MNIRLNKPFYSCPDVQVKNAIIKPSKGEDIWCPLSKYRRERSYNYALVLYLGAAVYVAQQFLFIGGQKEVILDCIDDVIVSRVPCFELRYYLCPKDKWYTARNYVWVEFEEEGGLISDYSEKVEVEYVMNSIVKVYHSGRPICNPSGYSASLKQDEEGHWIPVIIDPLVPHFQIAIKAYASMLYDD